MGNSSVSKKKKKKISIYPVSVLVLTDFQVLNNEALSILWIKPLYSFVMLHVFFKGRIAVKVREQQTAGMSSGTPSTESSGGSTVSQEGVGTGILVCCWPWGTRTSLRELNCTGETLALSPVFFCFVFCFVFACVFPALGDLHYSKFSINGQQQWKVLLLPGVTMESLGSW